MANHTNCYPNTQRTRTKWFYFILSTIIILFLSSSGFSQIIVNDNWIQQNISEGALFFDQSGQTYRFETDFIAEGTAVFVVADNIVINLNGHTITFGTSNRNGSIGINPFRQRSAVTLGSDDQSFSRTASGGSGGRNTIIKNGRVIWGGTSGTWAAAVGGYYAASPINIQNMHLESGGQDGECVYMQWADINLSDSYCVNKSTSTQNRHDGPASIKSSGKIVAYNNIIFGGNSAIVCGSGSNIYNNVLRHSGFATNGYGVWLYRNSGVISNSNIIAPSNGRGILYNAGDNHRSMDNLIVVHEAPNQEYGSGLNPPCLRIRYDANNNYFYGNKCLAIGGEGLTAASGAYLSNDGGMRNHIYDNEFRAILTMNPDAQKYANAITFEKQGIASSYTNDRIENNSFGSNNYLLRLAGFDGSCYQKVIQNNRINWIDGNSTYTWFVNIIDGEKYDYQYPPSNQYVTQVVLQQVKNEIKNEVNGFIAGESNNRQRSTFYTGYYEYDAFITIIDMELGPGVSMEPGDVFVRSGARSENNIKIGHSLYVHCVDSESNPIRNMTIQVNDNKGSSFSISTDGDGNAKLELIDYALVKPDGAETSTKELYSGHIASITGFDAVTLPPDIRNDQNNRYILYFGGNGGNNDIPATPINLRISDM